MDITSKYEGNYLLDLKKKKFNWIHFKLKKPDQANLTPALPSGDMKSILEHVGEEQLSVVQRDIC